MRDTIRQLLESAGVEDFRTTEKGFLVSCPLPEHEDKTPSFDIECEQGLWRCYGCKQTGNLPQLVHRLFGVSLEKAVRDYAALVSRNKPWPEPMPEHRGKVNDSIPESVLTPYRALCPRYMTDDRGFQKKFLQKMGVGYDPATSRVVFPIRDTQGRLVGLTRRTTIGQEPKYLHTKFSKGDHLYLGEYLREPIRRGDTCVIVEGHIDALRLYALTEGAGKTRTRVHKDLDRQGVPLGAAVAIMGSSPTKTQIKLVLRSFSKVLLAFDNDDAGQSAHEITLRALLEKGARSVYTLHYDKPDPGALGPDDRVHIEETL